MLCAYARVFCVQKAHETMDFWDVLIHFKTFHFIQIFIFLGGKTNGKQMGIPF